MALTGREKATIFLSILGADTASRVLRYLPDEIADLIAAGINHLPSPSPDALAEVLGDYKSHLALPEAPSRPMTLSTPSSPRKSYSFLIYERQQTVAFLLSLLPPEERAEALLSMPRDRALIEELIDGLKVNPLRSKLQEKMSASFAGKLF